MVCEYCRAYIDRAGKTLVGLSLDYLTDPEWSIVTKYWCPACDDEVPEKAFSFHVNADQFIAFLAPIYPTPDED